MVSRFLSICTDEANMKDLHMEATAGKAPSQTKDTMLASMRELNALSQTNDGEKRAGLFHKLVSEIGQLQNETLSHAVTEMLEVSSLLTWQALAQCGTPECTSAILQILRTFDRSSLEIDAVVYSMGFLPNVNIQDMLTMAQYKQSKAIMYSLSNSVRRYANVNELFILVFRFMFLNNTWLHFYAFLTLLISFYLLSLLPEELYNSHKFSHHVHWTDSTKVNPKSHLRLLLCLNSWPPSWAVIAQVTRTKFFWLLGCVYFTPCIHRHFLSFYSCLLRYPKDSSH